LGELRIDACIINESLHSRFDQKSPPSSSSSIVILPKVGSSTGLELDVEFRPEVWVDGCCLLSSRTDISVSSTPTPKAKPSPKPSSPSFDLLRRRRPFLGYSVCLCHGRMEAFQFVCWGRTRQWNASEMKPSVQRVRYIQHPDSERIAEWTVSGGGGRAESDTILC
jgi:hypothetical protein